MERITLVDAVTGVAQWLKGTGGAAHVADVGRAVQSHNRIITTAGNAVATDIGTATWTAEEGVYACRFRVYGGTPGNEIKLCFDASPVDDSSDTTQAQAWLTTAAAAEATDVEYFIVSMAGDVAAQVGPVGVAEWSEWFQFSFPLRRCDVVALSIDEALTVFIEAA